MLYVDGKIVGVLEAKREGVSLAGAEWQSGRYAAGLPESHALDGWHADEPLPFRYETTGTRTQFTNGLDPEPRSHEVFSFHRPVTRLGLDSRGLQGPAGADVAGATTDPARAGHGRAAPGAAGGDPRGRAFAGL